MFTINLPHTVAVSDALIGLVLCGALSSMSDAKGIAERTKGWKGGPKLSSATYVLTTMLTTPDPDGGAESYRLYLSDILDRDVMYTVALLRVVARFDKKGRATGFAVEPMTTMLTPAMEGWAAVAEAEDALNSLVAEARKDRAPLDHPEMLRRIGEWNRAVFPERYLGVPAPEPVLARRCLVWGRDIPVSTGTTEGWTDGGERLLVRLDSRHKEPAVPVEPFRVLLFPSATVIEKPE